MYRTLAVTVVTMLCATASASAGDAWWRVCRPLADYNRPRYDRCAYQEFKWATQDVFCAPRPCVRKRCSLKEACCEYRAAMQEALRAPAVCCNLKLNLYETLNAYKRAAGELRKCRKCESR